jgi:signal peptidase I
MMNKIQNLWKENRGFVLFVFLMFAFRSVIADWNVVPTGSMKPTILEGDRILVNKMAYDLRVPFTHASIVKLSDPQRGDIIVFDSIASDKRLVKRVIGMPGDTVAMIDNRLMINGKSLEYTVNTRAEDFIDISENLLGKEHAVRLQKFADSRFASFAPLLIPPGYFLALGDNRDRSADSRVIGLVPRAEIVGRSSTVVPSLDYDDYYLPRPGRFFITL